MSAPGPFELTSQTLGALPVLSHFLRRIGLAGYLARHLPCDDPRLRPGPAVVIGLVVRSIVVARRPACAIGEWAAAYRYQPSFERRNHILKGPQQVAPVYLETAHRIEALLLCHFLAMLTEALIERQICTSMKAAGLTSMPLYPELRNCPAPSADRILEIFDGIQRRHLISDGSIVQTFEPALTRCISRSSTSCTSPPASTPPPATPEVGAYIAGEKCGTSGRMAPESADGEGARAADTKITLKAGA